MKNNNDYICIGQAEIKRFLNSRREQGVPEKQLRLLGYRLGGFGALLPEGEPITSDTLRKGRKALLSSGLSPRTVECYVTAVNQLLEWAGHEELCFTSGTAADLTGRVFGRLTALEPLTERRDHGRSILWRCRCYCGVETKVTAGQLLAGRVQSCGCLRTERLRENNGYDGETILKQVLSGTVRKDNSSGCPGVWRRGDKWSARIQYRGRIYALGTYNRLEDAIRARREAETWVRDDAAELISRLRESERTVG